MSNVSGAAEHYEALSLALARMGFRVSAVDTSRRLLAELEARRGALPIEVVHADMLEVLDVPAAAAARDASGYDVAVCIGDTLTHLAASDHVRHLFRSVRALLAPSALLALTFRKSRYRKLPLAPAWTASALEKAGFGIEHRGDESGMCSIVACATAS